MKNHNRVIVVGGGIAGLAIAARCAAQGKQVTLLEAAPQFGGKVGEWRINGFRFDLGPSLFTLPQLLDELFHDCGFDPKDFYQYRKLDVVTRYFWEDGSQMDAWSDHQKLEKELVSFSPNSLDSVKEHLKEAKAVYTLTEPLFLRRSLHKWSTWFNWQAFRGMLKAGSLRSFTSMNEVNAARFKDPRLAQLFNRYATYNGSDPYRAPATLNLIAHLEHDEGAYYPVGGIRMIAEALISLCQRLGVTMKANAPVSQILTSGNRVTGVSVGEQVLEADEVVCNADIRTAYEKLLPQLPKPASLIKQEPSSSALIFYWGVKGHFPELDLHNLFFSDAYQEEFQALQEGRLFLDPSVYVYVSQRLNPTDAPEGCENWFVMVNAPFLRPGQDWERMKEQTRLNILAKLEHRLGQRIRDKIVVEQVLDPAGIEQLTASWRGALYGSSSNSPWSAFLRQANFHPKVKGLFFCGGSVHPGGGIPLCLLSASITSKLMH